MIDDLVSRPVITGRQPRFSNRYTDTIGESLPKWPRGGLDARRQTTLRVTGRFAPPFSKMFDLLERQIVTRKVQQAVQQHRPMSTGQYETIAVEPLRVPRIMLEKLGPESKGHRSSSHWHAGMTGIRVLDGV